MSDFIRMMGMKMHRKGTCNKCGNPTDQGYHANCDRWPVRYGIAKGFHYVANSKESTLEDLKNVIDVILSGEAKNTPVRFELKILQTANVPDEASSEPQ